MTEDKARKIATRQRMAETGEPYSVARRAVEDEHDAAEDLRDDSWDDSVAEDAGGREAGDAGGREAEARAQEHAVQARELAEHARHLAEQARERAERAEEDADRAEEAADLTQEAADLTNEWGDDETIAQAERRADEARAAAQRARRRAERAEEQADQTEEAADQADEAANEAEDLAGDTPHHFRRHQQSHRPPRPPQPPRPPRPMRGHRYGPPGPRRVQPDRDPAERLQDRVEQVIQRFEVMRDRADRLITAAERIFGPGRSETVRAEPAHKPKLRPIRQAISGLTWDFTAVAGWRSGYFKVSGIGAPMSSKACRWVLVGSASIAMVTSVPVYRTWLRVSVARCSSRPRKLW